MSLTVKKTGVHKPTTQPYVKKDTWRAAKQVYIKKAGTWKEIWPLVPNSPASASINTSFDGAKIVVNTSWTAPPAGGHPYDRYISQLVFRDPNGGEYPQGGVGHTTGTLSYTHTNGASGYQHLAGWTVKVQVWAGRNPTAYHYEYWSPVRESAYASVIQLPIPPVATGVTASIASCALTTTWTHPGSPALTGFQIQVWVNGAAASTYTVGPTVRSYAGQPWNPDNVGRHGVNVQVRALGTGGESAWTYTYGIMPGPLSISSPHYNGETFYVLLSGNYEGFHRWADYYGSPTWAYQGFSGGNGGGQFWNADSSSTGYARDNSTRRRLVYQPYNTANGWTGRLQGSGYVIKIPNPVYLTPDDTNTWWSNPIPGKWRTNPQADDWFYQGKSISGNSYGTWFYRTKVKDYFDDARIGYNPGISSWYVYVQRTYTGGLVAAVALNMWLHNRQDDALAAAPGLTDGPQAGPSLARSQQAWVQIPNSWWANILSGAARGISFFVDPGASDNQLRSEIGNVSNRYMILNKPHYGATISHGGQNRTCGTIVIYHSA